MIGQISRENCKESLRSFYDCEWLWEYPYEGGKPYRRYKSMTNREYMNFLKEEDVGRNVCYNHWLKTMGGFDEQEILQ